MGRRFIRIFDRGATSPGREGRDPVFVGGPDADRERAVRERIEPHPGRAPPRYAGSRPSRPGAFAPSVSRMGLRIAFRRASACASPRCQGRAYASWRASSLACVRALMAYVFAHHPLPRSGRVGCAGTLMASNIVPRRCSCAPHRSQGAPRGPGARETVPAFAWARR